MADHNPSQQTASKAHGPETPEHHTYNARNISARGFLLAVMHAPDVPIKDRIRALQHSFCIGITRVYTIKRRMALWIEYGSSERD